MNFLKPLLSPQVNSRIISEQILHLFLLAIFFFVCLFVFKIKYVYRIFILYGCFF